MRSYTVAMLGDGSAELCGAALASEYYGGMSTALYALSSTGSLELYPGEGLGRIISELRVARDIAAAEYPEDYDPLCALLKWCEAEHYRTEGICEAEESADSQCECWGCGMPAVHFPVGDDHGHCCRCAECDCE